VTKKNQLPCSLVFDEFPTIYFNGIDGLIATARSNRVATTLAIQNISQLKKGLWQGAGGCDYEQEVTEADIQENYLQIKLDVALIIENEIRKLQLLKRKGLDTDN